MAKTGKYIPYCGYRCTAIMVPANDLETIYSAVKSFSDCSMLNSIALISPFLGGLVTTDDILDLLESEKQPLNQLVVAAEQFAVLVGRAERMEKKDDY